MQKQLEGVWLGNNHSSSYVLVVTFPVKELIRFAAIFTKSHLSPFKSNLNTLRITAYQSEIVFTYTIFFASASNMGLIAPKLSLQLI